MQTEQQMDALLRSQVDDPRGLAQAVAIRAPHWAHSGIIGPRERREILVGRRVELICRMATPTTEWTLARQPATSRARLDGSRLVADMPGGYAVALDVGGFVRVIHLLAVTAELLDRIGPGVGQNDRVLTLRSRLNDHGRDFDSLARALETNTAEAWGALAAPTH